MEDMDMDMDHLTTTFSDSDDGSSTTTTPTQTPSPDADMVALGRLSENLSSAFHSQDFAFLADCHVTTSTSSSSVPLHRCILSARSPFFRDLFSRNQEKNKRFQVKELTGVDFEVGHEAFVLVVEYLYSGKVGVLPKSVCTCVDEECGHVACRPVVEFLAQVLFAASRFQVLELVNLFQRRLLDVLDKVATDDLSLILSVANLCNKSCLRLLNRCLEMVARSDLNLLEKALPPDIVGQIAEARSSLGLISPEGNTTFPDKHARRIHRALDSDDVELLRMLLKEGHATLDDAFALHYAVEHCDSKITTELLDLGLANVNHRNLRGYTVLHVAAMRKEPKVIVSLLTKGARPSDLTLDGRKAVQISKRLTKFADYLMITEEGNASPKDRLCIEILEQAERIAPQLGEASSSLAVAGDDLRGRLLYLENRVALARILFPVEARVVMDNAQVDGTLEFSLGSSSNPPPRKHRTTVDLNETPFRMKEEHLARMRALSRTVELGKRFIPRCSAFLDKIMDDDITELTCLGKDTSDERRRRYLDLQNDLEKAFNEDKEELDRSTISSSSSSTSIGVVRKRN